MTINLIISGVHQSHLGCWGDRSENVKLRGLDYVSVKDKIISCNVFGSYLVEMVEHLNNAVH